MHVHASSSGRNDTRSEMQALQQGVRGRHRLPGQRGHMCRDHAPSEAGQAQRLQLKRAQPKQCKAGNAVQGTYPARDAQDSDIIREGEKGSNPQARALEVALPLRRGESPCL